MPQQLKHQTERDSYPWEKSYPAGVTWDAPLKDGTLVELLETSVATFSELPAFSYFSWRASYKEFGALVDRAAAGLSALGLGRGGRLALLLPNTPWHPVLFFAALKLGAQLVHISPLDPERDVVHKIGGTSARILATTDVGGMRDAGLMLAAKLGTAGLIDTVILCEDAFWHQGRQALRAAETGRVVSGIGLLDATPLPAVEFPTVVPDDVALLQFTGGTTGLPKAALLTHGNLHSAVEIYRVWGEPQGLAKRGEGRVLLVLPLFHIFALSGVMLTAVQYGAEIVLHTRFDAEAAIDDIEKRRITFFPGVPTMWIAIANLPGIEKRDLSSLERMSSGGAPCPVEVEQKIGALTKVPFGSSWGMTETAPAGTIVPTHNEIRHGTIGVPCGLAGGRIGEGVAQGLRTGRLLCGIAHLPVGDVFEPFEGPRLLWCRLALDLGLEHGQGDVDASAMFAVECGQRARDGRAPVAALRAIAAIAEPRHELCPGKGDAIDSPAGDGRLYEKPKPGNEGHMM
jgi:long-chain acyl-CoA synthetase